MKQKKSLTIRSPFPNYNRKKIGRSYIASHVWRYPKSFNNNKVLASQDPLLNSFIPNLVWLPTQISKLTDREGKYAQRFLQKVSYQIYAETKTNCNDFTQNIWENLPIPTIEKDDRIELNRISFFNYNDKFIERRKEKIRNVIDSLEYRIQGSFLSKKIISSSYTEGLNCMHSDDLSNIYNSLKNYEADI